MRRRDVLAGTAAGVALSACATPVSTGGAQSSQAPSVSTSAGGQTVRAAAGLSPGGRGRPQKNGSGDRQSGRYFATRSTVWGVNGAAATAHPTATRVAIDTLRAGGSAMDAAIAANAVLGFVEPVGCGIGGDLYAIVWDPKTKTTRGYNGSGRAPRGQDLATITRRAAAFGGVVPSFGSLSVSVPGAVDGWFALHGEYGRLPMSRVLGPAIDLAEGGEVMPEMIGEAFARNIVRLSETNRNGMIEELDNARATYAPGGSTPREGDIWKNPALGATYRRIAEGGRAAYYEGPIARTIDTYMKAIGGPLRYEDLAAHRGNWVDVYKVRYRDAELHELGPNTQGVIACQMAQMLERFDLKAAGHLSARAIHLATESKRLAFADRAKLYADPAFTGFDARRLIDPAYAARRSALIREDAILASTEAGLTLGGDTTYLAVADKDGMMVSLIQSNYRGMGSGLVPTGLGFMLQNRGELFALDPAHPNVYAPGKRPFQTIIPAFATKGGEPWMAFGLMGGDMQPMGHFQILSNMVDHGLTLQEAGDAARWRHEGSQDPTGKPEEGTGVLHVEDGMPAETKAGLESLGWKLGPSDGGFGGYQAVMRDPRGTWAAATEMRKDGAAMAW
jgi:gamma-glutamyltranspeptidase / glutathione hydrolase